MVGCELRGSGTDGCTYTGRTHNKPPAIGTICRSPNTTSVPSMLSRLSCWETDDSVFIVLDTVNAPSSADVTSYATNVPEASGSLLAVVDACRLRLLSSVENGTNGRNSLNDAWLSPGD